MGELREGEVALVPCSLAVGIGGIEPSLESATVRDCFGLFLYDELPEHAAVSVVANETDIEVDARVTRGEFD